VGPRWKSEGPPTSPSERICSARKKKRPPSAPPQYNQGKSIPYRERTISVRAQSGSPISLDSDNHHFSVFRARRQFFSVASMPFHSKTAPLYPGPRFSGNRRLPCARCACAPPSCFSFCKMKIMRRAHAQLLLGLDRALQHGWPLPRSPKQNIFDDPPHAARVLWSAHLEFAPAPIRGRWFVGTQFAECAEVAARSCRAQRRLNPPGLNVGLSHS